VDAFVLLNEKELINDPKCSILRFNSSQKSGSDQMNVRKIVDTQVQPLPEHPVHGSQLYARMKNAEQKGTFLKTTQRASSWVCLL
jgi:hypothetical protein